MADRLTSGAAGYPPVFIVGLPGSGTTLLRSMLNSHPDLHIPFESKYFQHVWKARDELAPVLDSEAGIERLLTIFSRVIFSNTVMGDIPLEVFREALLSLPPHQRTLPRLLSTLSEVPAHYHGKPRWGAKDPRFVALTDVLYALYPDCYLIHIIRDGRAVVASQVGKKLKRAELKGTAPRTYPEICLPSGAVVTTNLLDWAAAWREHLDKVSSCAAAAPSARYLRIRYEDLVIKPHETLAEVCRFIEAPFDERMLSYHEDFKGQLPDDRLRRELALIGAPSDPEVAQRWRNQLSPASIHAVQMVLSSYLQRHGYELVSVSLPEVDRRALERAVSQWLRRRRWQALRARAADAAWLQPACRFYHWLRDGSG